MSFLSFLFGSNRNVVAETVEVFRPNAEKTAKRAADHATAALSQYAAEFHDRSNRTPFDVLADGLNRLVRPVVTLGLLYPIPATVYAPERMAGVWSAIATLPQGYWAVVGIVLPFYFGGRMQVKALASSHWQAAAIAASTLGGKAETLPDADKDNNPALDDWEKQRGG